MATVTKVLFVCLGNICRSPAAEAIFIQQLAIENLTEQFSIDSAGTSNYHEGELPDPRMRDHGAKRGYELTSLSRPITAADGEQFDWIVVMDRSNEKNVKAILSERHHGKIKRMCEFTRLGYQEVPDPYFGGPEGFEQVFDLLEDACTGLLNSLRLR